MIEKHYLIDCIAEHPGGWLDIINFLKANTITLVVDNSDWERHNVFQGTKNRVYANVTTTRLALEELEDLYTEGPSGVMAAMVIRAMLGLGMPVPGDKDWIKPCDKWKPPKGKSSWDQM